MNCPPNETLHRLSLGFLEDGAPVRAHADRCPACIRRLRAIEGESELLRTAFRRRGRLPVWAAAAVLLAALFGTTLLWPEPVALVVPSFDSPSVPQRRLVLESSLEAPIVPAKEAVSDHVESLDDESFKSVKGESLDFVSDKPFRGKGTYDAIGGGGGSGGRYGGRRAGPAEPPAGMLFRDPGVNPAVPTAAETLSTFGLDVDTASYSIVRNLLRRGQLPPKEAVRVEEFLNSFRYRDPRPPKGAFAVLLEAAPSPFRDGRHLLRIAVQAREIPESERKDVVLTFVVDVSGSMGMENRIGLVKRSLRRLVDRLRPTDRVGIAVYGTDARKLLDPIPAARRDEILGVVDELRIEGSTNLEAGLRVGYGLAAARFDPKAANRVVVCTDGVANNGVTDADALLRIVATERAKGVWLSVLGFGMGNLNDALMERLADAGNGNYAYIDDDAEARKIFDEKLTGLLEVVAADAKLQVEFDPATVETYRLVGYENRRVANKDFRNDTVDAGEVGAGHRVTALYELALKPEAEGRLATVRLRYKEPGTGEVPEQQESLSRGQVLDSAAKASASWRLASAVAQFAELLRGSPHAANVSLNGVLAQAVQAAADLDGPADALELVELVRKAAELRK
jgi:Ca-activated chloride channel family protein